MTVSPSPAPGPPLEVAAASGILAGSLYLHFDSKEAIAVELVRAYHADLVRVVREFASVPEDPLSALRAFALEIAAVSFRHPAALQISLFDAPTTASSSLKTVVHAERASVDRLWRTLISAASAASAIKDGVDSRILRYVLHRTALNAGLLSGWQTQSGIRAAAECITSLIFDGLATGVMARADSSKATRAVDDARARWVAESAERKGERGGQASNLYRYFESKDSMIHAILGDFSDRLTEAYRDVIQVGSSVVETLDAILWLLDQAGRHFSREVEILQGFKRLLDIGVADRYQEGAQLRFGLLVSVIDSGVAAGDLRQVAGSDLVATCLREIAWSPMRNLAPISPLRVRDFYRHSVLSGAAARG
ncbi:MAG TPA: TetR/AcrR family transcriptional regulator [Streptosporangiaceae bacterium]